MDRNTKREASILVLKTTISSEFDGGNIGVQFEISATFRGKVVKPAIVMADGESANPGELVMFTTNGEGWQHIGEWLKNNNKNTKTYIPQNTDNLFGSSPSTNINGMNLYRTNLDQLRRSIKSDRIKSGCLEVLWKCRFNNWGSRNRVFGPNISSSDVAVPLVMTKGLLRLVFISSQVGNSQLCLDSSRLMKGMHQSLMVRLSTLSQTVDGITGKKSTNLILVT